MPLEDEPVAPLGREEIRRRLDRELRDMLTPTLTDRLPDGAGSVDDLRAAASRPPSTAGTAAVESLPRPDGESLELRVHRGSGPAAILWLHGGGMVLGSAGNEDPLCAAMSGELGVTVVAPDYRLAPEHPYPAALEDCLSALGWMSGRFERVVLAGESAGAGLAAAVALRARDLGGPSVAGLHLHSPMIDDRGTTRSSRLLAETLVWSRQFNELAWSAYLGGRDADARAAPARETDLHGLPPTYIDVGELDLFRDEDVELAVRLMAAGTRVELHVDLGAFHGSALRFPDATVSRQARARRMRSLATMLDPS